MEKATVALMSVCVAASFLLSCSEPLKPIERETLEDYQRTLQSSSSSETSSSSSVVPNSSSSVSVCGKTQYDPDVQFCHNNYIVEKCGGKEFNPPEEVCNTGVVGKMCGSTWYNLQTHFCFGGTTPTLLCGGNEYTGSQFCRSGEVYDKCGSIGEYDPSKFYCHNGSLSSCGNLPLNPDTQFCSGSMRYDKCGGSDYNPDTQFCLSSTITPLCGGQTFTSSQFCHGNTVRSKCGGTVEYNPGTEDCCGSSKYTLATHFCYDNSKVGSKCGTRTEIFDPNLYECRDVSKIYLKTPVNYESENYEAVLIGTQTWMAENLNYDAISSLCYENNSANCSTYGRLYNWSTAMALDPSCNSNSCSNQIGTKHKGICPSGWHIPSSDEWEALITFVGSSTAGTKLKATSGWNQNGNGTDEYGFSALPGGAYFLDLYLDGSWDLYFSGVGEIGIWWSASEPEREYDYENAYKYFYSYTYCMYDGYETVDMEEYGRKPGMLSVRCVKD